MTLIAAGQNTRNRAMQGLQAMSQEEAEREALYQQMRQSQKAQNAQLAGTGLGIAGSYAVNNPDNVAALGSKIFGGGQAGVSATSALAAASNPAAVGALASPVAPSGVTGALTAASNPAAVGALSSSATGAGAAAGTGAATGAATAGTGAATAGTAATAAGSLAAVAAPLAIGLGAFFFLNKLFD